MHEPRRYRVAMTRDDVERAYRKYGYRSVQDLSEVCAVTRAIERATNLQVMVAQEYWGHRGAHVVPRSLPLAARQAINAFDDNLRTRATIKQRVAGFMESYPDGELPVFEVVDEPAEYVVQEWNGVDWRAMGYYDDMTEAEEDAKSLPNEVRIMSADLQTRFRYYEATD